MSLTAIRQRARRDSVEFPHQLANHAPMIVVALDRLGASRARVADWCDEYRGLSGLVPPPPPVAPILAQNWDAALGDRTRERDYREFFTGEVRRLGLAGAVRLYVPQLVQGVAGSGR